MLKLQNKIEFENNLWLAKVDSSRFNASKFEVMDAIVDIASIVQGKLGLTDRISEEEQDIKAASSNHMRKLALIERLGKESGGKASTVFEFIPVVSFVYTEDMTAEGHNNMFRYGVFKQEIFYTNLRNILKNNLTAHYNTEEEVKDFAVVGKIPWKSLYHIDRHRAFVFMESTSRINKFRNNVEFYIPEGLSKTNKMLLKLANNLGNYTSILLHKMGIKAEIANMFLPDTRLVTFAMAAWKHDTSAWDNLFKVRGEKTGTMDITEKIVNNIKVLIDA